MTPPKICAKVIHMTTAHITTARRTATIMSVTIADPKMARTEDQVIAIADNHIPAGWVVDSGAEHDGQNWIVLASA